MPTLPPACRETCIKPDGQTKRKISCVYKQAQAVNSNLSAQLKKRVRVREMGNEKVKCELKLTLGITNL